MPQFRQRIPPLTDMCTVTFIGRKNGYALGTNRDERLSRAKGLPPAVQQRGGCKVMAPVEPSGGTWIALNDLGVCFALINWYAMVTNGPAKPVSRGNIIPSVIQASSIGDAERLLARVQLKRIKPFRLIGVFGNTRQIVEWRWDGDRLLARKHGWGRRQWISSGFDEPQAQRVRSRIFRSALNLSKVGSLQWLRRLHGSHRPENGPFATCMHRADAATVSYTEVVATPRQSVLRYHDGSLCLCSSARWTKVISPRPVA